MEVEGYANRRARIAQLVNVNGALMVILAICMVPPLLLALWDGSPDRVGQAVAFVVTAVLGLVGFITTRQSTRTLPVGHREAFLIAGVGWLVASLVGALPYFFYAHLAPGEVCQPLGDRLPIGHEFCSFTNGVFEAASGFTTTGSSIIKDGLWTEYGMAGDRPGLPRGILLWRSMTHFVGGMGIVVLGIALLPLLGVGGMQLYKAEVPGPTKDKLAPRVKETARLLWEVYLVLSAVLVLLLLAGGMDLFEAVCHSMATMATGGFSTRATSVAGFQSAYIDWVLAVGMFVAGMNFTLHFMARRQGLKAYRADAEARAYALICFVATVLVALALWGAGQGMSLHDAVRHAAFQVATIITTTGFASTDFEQWTFAPLAVFVLVALMFVGGMAGSTAGGIKVVRHQLAVKLWWRELFFLSHPRATRPVRLGTRVVSPEVLRAALAFVGAYLFLVVLGALLYTLDGQDLVSATTASASSLGNIGPGLGNFGPMDNYSVLSPWALWVSSLQMILGRLELYTLLVLLTPGFWRR